MKISVAMCTFNGERFLREQVDSILSQKLRVDEIVVCDDGSTDATLEILENYNKQHPGLFRIYRNEVNLRSVRNFEKAIGLCTGDIIFLSDQDDVWTAEKTIDYIAYFNANPKIEVLASNGYALNDSSEVVHKYAIWEVPQVLRDHGREVNYEKIISTLSNLATGATMAIRKKIIPELMPFPIIKDFHHDEWIAIVASKKNAFELLPGKYFYYRIHENQQVGGVFYEKNDHVKNKFLKIFSLDDWDLSFRMFKQRLQRMSRSYQKQLALSAHPTAYRQHFLETVENITCYRLQVAAQMKKKYPLRTFILGITDHLLKKRKF